jgi:hypothetical protein
LKRYKSEKCRSHRFAATPLIKLRDFHSEIQQNDHVSQTTDVSLVRHPLSKVCPALTASTTIRMASMTIGALSIMTLCPECGRRVRSVDDRSEVWRCIRRQLAGLDELVDDIDEFVAGREHDDRHGP